MSLDKDQIAQQFIQHIEPMTTAQEIDLAFSTLTTLPADVRAYVVDAVEKHNVEGILGWSEDTVWQFERLCMAVTTTDPDMRRLFGVRDDEYENAKAAMAELGGNFVSATQTFKNIIQEKGAATHPLLRGHVEKMSALSEAEQQDSGRHLDALLDTRRIVSAILKSSRAQSALQGPKQ